MIFVILSKDRICGRMRECMEKHDNRNQSSKKKTKITSKQIVAICGVVLLVLMYLVTLVVAIVDNSESGRWFMSCIFATVSIPILIWIYTWMYGRLTGKHTITDAKQELGAVTTTTADSVSPENPNSSGSSK